MARKPIVAAFSVAAVLVTLSVEGAASGATSLLLPQSIGFSVLGHSCGGIQEQSLATGFDATSSYPTGNVYLQTRCGGSGKGGGYHVTTYSAWVGARWDFTGAVVSYTRLTSAPNVDPTVTAVDGFGNEVYTTLTSGSVPPANCTVTTCSYRAYLALAPTFVPAPRVTGISATIGPTAGGTSVTITGTGFTGATAVSFGATPAASFTASGDTSITALSPAASAGTVDVTVTTAGGTSATFAGDQFTFVAVPVVTRLDPDNAPINGGTLVTITGANFIDVAAVYFGDTPAGFTVNDASSITTIVPAGEAVDTVDVTVVTVGGTSPTSAVDVFTYTPSVPTPICGDGTVDPGEQCDDGAANGQPGDCCSITCTYQPAGTTCTDDGSPCTSDVCDGAGACTHPAAPSLTCIPPDVTAGASLLLRAKPGGNQVQFKWGKGPVVPVTDFGDPTGGEVLQLCVYDQTPGTYALVVGGSPSTSGGGTWTRTLTGWRFRSMIGAPDGITSVVLKAGTLPLQGKVQVKGVNSPSFRSLPLTSSVIVQFQTSLGTCWGATFSTPMLNTPTVFKAKSD